MRKITIFRGAAVMLALLVSTEAAQAWYIEYRGTQDEVRAACIGEDEELVEGVSFSSCFSENGFWVQCFGGGIGRRGGERDISGGRGSALATTSRRKASWIPAAQATARPPHPAHHRLRRPARPPAPSTTEPGAIR